MVKTVKHKEKKKSDPIFDENYSFHKKAVSNINDYIIWRGDLTFKASPFNEVDSLILSKLANFNFTGIVPLFSEDKEGVKLKLAADKYFIEYEKNPVGVSAFSNKEQLYMLKLMSESVRYSKMLLCDYIHETDEESVKQFSALRISLDKKTDYIAFRGTDDTLVGWKENFMMSYTCPVASQISACDYLNRTEKALFGKDIILGGHSKGGNLAIYAAVNARDSIKKRITAVYSHDGPGFERSFIASEAFCEIKPKIRTIVPHSSLVGMLMDHGDDFEIVSSKNVGPMQHDAFMWEITANHFVYDEDLSASSKYWDKTIAAWVESTPVEKRREFIDWFFDLLYSTGARTFKDITKNTLTNMVKIIEELNNGDKETNDMAKTVIAILIKECTMPIKTAFWGDRKK